MYDAENKQTYPSDNLLVVPIANQPHNIHLNFVNILVIVSTFVFVCCHLYSSFSSNIHPLSCFNHVDLCEWLIVMFENVYYLIMILYDYADW